MKYLLAFVRDQDRMFEENEEEMRRAMEAWNEFDRAATEAGVMIANEALELPEDRHDASNLGGWRSRSRTGPSRRPRSSSADSA